MLEGTVGSFTMFVWVEMYSDREATTISTGECWSLNPLVRFMLNMYETPADIGDASSVREIVRVPELCTQVPEVDKTVPSVCGDMCSTGRAALSGVDEPLNPEIVKLERHDL